MGLLSSFLSFTDLFKQGLVRVSNSSSVAQIVMVRKFDDSIRVCVDYITLNECTLKDSFPLPRIDDLLDKLRNDTPEPSLYV